MKTATILENQQPNSMEKERSKYKKNSRKHVFIQEENKQLMKKVNNYYDSNDHILQVEIPDGSMSKHENPIELDEALEDQGEEQEVVPDLHRCRALSGNLSEDVEEDVDKTEQKKDLNDWDGMLETKAVRRSKGDVSLNGMTPFNTPYTPIKLGHFMAVQNGDRRNGSLSSGSNSPKESEAKKAIFLSSLFVPLHKFSYGANFVLQQIVPQRVAELPVVIMARSAIALGLTAIVCVPVCLCITPFILACLICFSPFILVGGSAYCLYQLLSLSKQKIHSPEKYFGMANGAAPVNDNDTSRLTSNDNFRNRQSSRF